jgi:hypothetical protein
MPLAIVLIVVFGILLFVAYLYLSLSTQPARLQVGEEVVGKMLADLWIDRISYRHQRGRVILTDRRLLWVPSRLPFPRMEAQSIDLDEIEDLRVVDSPIMWSRNKAVAVTARGSVFEFYVGHIGLLRDEGAAAEWLRLISSARISRARERGTVADEG